VTGAPPQVIIALVLALAIAAGAIALLRYADRLEKREAAHQAALANARRDAQLRDDFGRHADEALAVAAQVDWSRYEHELQS
jgi:hypothetical protein